MRVRDRSGLDGGRKRMDGGVSRRAVMGSSGLMLLGFLSGSAFGQERGRESEREGPPRKMQERIEQSRAFSERLRNAGSMEERMKIMAERSAWERKRAVERLKDELGISDKDWPVVKPRIEAVYNLVHPQPRFGPGDREPRTEVEHRSSELRELLRDEETGADAIKAKLTALRAAKEKARQGLAAAQKNLRQLMTIRQEAVLVLNELLD